MGALIPEVTAVQGKAQHISLTPQEPAQQPVAQWKCILSSQDVAVSDGWMAKPLR